MPACRKRGKPWDRGPAVEVFAPRNCESLSNANQCQVINQVIISISLAIMHLCGKRMHLWRCTSCHVNVLLVSITS